VVPRHDRGAVTGAGRAARRRYPGATLGGDVGRRAARVVRNTAVLIETAHRLGLPIVVEPAVPQGARADDPADRGCALPASSRSGLTSSSSRPRSATSTPSSRAISDRVRHGDARLRVSDRARARRSRLCGARRSRRGVQSHETELGHRVRADRTSGRDHLVDRGLRVRSARPPRVATTSRLCPS